MRAAFFFMCMSRIRRGFGDLVGAGLCPARGLLLSFLSPTGYFLSRKAGEFRAPARDASGGILSFLGERKYPKNAIQGGRKFRSSFPLENPPSLSDQRGRAAALPLWKHPPGGWAIIKSRLCREAAKVGGGQGPLVGVKGRTDSRASDVGHWLGMTPLRGVWADRVVRPYGGIHEVRRCDGGEGS